MSEEQKEQGRLRSFFEDLSVLMKTLTTILLAAAAALPILYTLGFFSSDDEQFESADCQSFTFNVTSFEQALPYSLHHTIKDVKTSHTFIYWLRVEGRNDCLDPMRIKVVLESLEGDDVLVNANRKSFSFRVEAGGKLEKKLYPNLEFERDPEGSFQVHWTIRRRPGDQLLHEGETIVRVRSKETFVWKLLAPNGVPISEKFLLASLASWADTGHQRITNRTQRLEQAALRGADPKKYAADLVEKAYEGLFESAAAGRRFELIPSAVLFPPLESGTRIIQAPANTLEKLKGDPIEAALLLAALIEHPLSKRGVHLMLVAREDDNERAVFLAWYVRGQPPQALDVTRVAELGFKENLEASTPRLAELIEAQPALKELRVEDGVFWVETPPIIAAIDFARARVKEGIAAFP